MNIFEFPNIPWVGLECSSLCFWLELFPTFSISSQFMALVVRMPVQSNSDPIWHNSSILNPRVKFYIKSGKWFWKGNFALFVSSNQFLWKYLFSIWMTGRVWQIFLLCLFQFILNQQIAQYKRQIQNSANDTEGS